MDRDLEKTENSRIISQFVIIVPYEDPRWNTVAHLFLYSWLDKN
jgi:hypothetical protein